MDYSFAAGIEDALMRWASDCPLFTGGAGLGAPLLGYLREDEGACALRPVAGEAVVTSYVDGGRLVAYDFFFELMLPLSVTTDHVNALNMSVGRAWQQWIEEAEASGHYPDLGEGRVCTEVRPMSNMPQMARVYEGSMAKYHFPARITYVENLGR